MKTINVITNGETANETVINRPILELEENLAAIHFDIIVGSAAQVSTGIATNVITDWVASVTTNSKILFLDATHVPTANITLTDTGLIIRMESKEAIINNTTYTFSSTGADCDIEINFTTTNDNITFSGSRSILNNTGNMRFIEPIIASVVGTIAFDIIVGSAAQVSTGIATNVITDWVASVTTNSKILFLDATHVPTANITLTDTGLIIRMESKGTSITTTTYTFSSTGGNCDIELNVSDESKITFSGSGTRGIINRYIYAGDIEFRDDISAAQGTFNNILLNGYYLATGNYTITDSISMVRVSATATITLPTAVAGKIIFIKNTGTGTVTVKAGTADQLEDVALGEYEMDTQFESVTVMAFDDTDWFIV